MCLLYVFVIDIYAIGALSVKLAFVIDWAYAIFNSLDYEYVAKGFLLRRGKMKVTVSTIFKMTRPGSTDLNHLEQVTGSHLVEASVMTSKTVSV